MRDIIKENWLWWAILVGGIIFVAAFASLGQAGGPVEPPSPIRVPYTELRAANPDMPLNDFFLMVHPWEVLAQQINGANRFTYEAIRGEQVKECGRIWISSTGSGAESTWVALGGKYDSSAYIVLVAKHRGAESTPDVDSSAVSDLKSGIISHNKYSNGFWIKKYLTDHFWAHWALLVP